MAADEKNDVYIKEYFQQAFITRFLKTQLYLCFKRSFSGIIILACGEER